MRLVTQLVAAVASAVLYGAAFPPNPWRDLAWVALVPLLVVARDGSPRRVLVLTWIWTVVLGCVVNDWFPGLVANYFGQGFAVGFVLFLGVCTFTCGLQVMAFALAYRVLARPSVATPFVVAAAWVTADMLRLLAFGGDPWALLGYSQVGRLALVQVADVAGVHGITFVVVAVNAAIAEVVWARRHPAALAPAVRGLATALLLVGATALYGAVRLATPIAAAGPRADVAVVQAHLPLGSQWQRAFYGRNLETYLRLSVDVLRSTNARLLVWPENAMTFFLAAEPSYRASIRSVLSRFGAELVAGGPHAGPDGEPPFHNSAFLVAPDGEIRARYDKQVLLPFAEYFPFGGIDILRRHFGRVREFVPGGDPTLLETAVGRAGVVVCNEGFFGAPAAARVRAGATLLVNLANDSWLAEPKYSEPAFDMVTLRAVEQRRWIVRASTAGPSAIVDPYGRVVQRTTLFQSVALAGAVEPVTVVTPYSRVGDLFAWGCVALTLAALVARGFVARRGAVILSGAAVEPAVRADA